MVWDLGRKPRGKSANVMSRVVPAARSVLRVTEAGPAVRSHGLHYPEVIGEGGAFFLRWAFLGGLTPL